MQHPDEGMIHAWLDGELSEDQANEISTHVSECPDCAASVAEARGLVAASTRILTALDDIPRGVAPRESPGVSESAAPALLPSRARRWYDRADVRAAAAVVFVAGASLILVRTRAPEPAREMMTMAAERAKAAPSVIADSNSPAPAETAEQSFTAKAPSPVTTESRDERQMATAPAPVRRQPQVAAPLGGLTLRGKADVSSKAQANTAITTDRLSEAVPATPMAADAAKALSPSANTGFIARKGVVSGATRSDIPAPGVVEGRVVDRGTGEGLRSAQIRVVGTALTASTDSTGKFTIPDVPAGNHQLLIRRIGYAQQHVALNVGQDTNVTANIGLEPTTLELSQVVTTAAGTTSNIAIVPLRVVRVDTIADTRQTIYELTGGTRVTLTDSVLDARLNKELDAGQSARRRVAAAPRPANSPQEKSAERIKDEVEAQSSARESKKTSLGVVAMALPPRVNFLAWTDRGHRYVLSGPLTAAELEALKTRIMQMRR